MPNSTEKHSLSFVVKDLAAQIPKKLVDGDDVHWVGILCFPSADNMSCTTNHI